MPYHESQLSEQYAGTFAKQRAEDPLWQLHFDCIQEYTMVDTISPVFGSRLPIRAKYNTFERGEGNYHVRRVVLYKHLPKKMYHVKMWDTDDLEYSWSGEEYATAAAMYCAMWMPMSTNDFHDIANWAAEYPDGIESMTLSKEQVDRLMKIRLTSGRAQHKISISNGGTSRVTPFKVTGYRMGTMDNPLHDRDTYTISIPNPLHLSEHAVSEYIVMQAMAHGVLDLNVQPTD